jgi:hypothetical protein
MSIRTGFLALSLAAANNVLSAQVVLSPTHYDVRFDVDYPAAQLRGTARITLKNLDAAPVREASLLLYRLMRVSAVRDDRGKDLAFRQSVVVFADFGQLQVNQLLVALPAPLAPGALTTIEVGYEGHLLGYAETGMRYIQDRIDSAFTILRADSYAYPQPGYPSSALNRSAPPWEFSYSARVTVPKGLTVANGGRLEGIDTSGDSVTFRYASLKPSWRMDFAIARYTELASASIRVFHLPGDSAGAAGVARAGAEAMDLFKRWFGPLRESAVLTFIEIPDGWGSQADVTTIIQSAAAFKDPDRHREVYHEISHLWNVPPTDRPSPRWNEGEASFLEYLVTQEVTGKPLVDERANQLVDWLRGELPKHESWRTTPLINYGRAGMTDLAYSVGALYFDLLYRLAGREAFNRIIGGFANEFGVSGGSTKDLMDIVRKTATVDLTRLNNDWILTPAWAERVAQSANIQALEAYYRAPPARGAPNQDSTEAIAAAQRWLALVDSGRYAASLDSAAPLFRQMAGTADSWSQFLRQARVKFPPNPGSSRVVVRFDKAYTPEGAPSGRYVRIDFRVGAAGATVPEFVVLQETPTGWRVAMYGTTAG